METETTQTQTETQPAAQPELTTEQIVAKFAAAVDELASAIQCSQVTDSNRSGHILKARSLVAEYFQM